MHFVFKKGSIRGYYSKILIRNLITQETCRYTIENYKQPIYDENLNSIFSAPIVGRIYLLLTCWNYNRRLSSFPDGSNGMDQYYNRLRMTHCHSYFKNPNRRTGIYVKAIND